MFYLCWNSPRAAGCQIPEAAQPGCCGRAHAQELWGSRQLQGKGRDVRKVGQTVRQSSLKRRSALTPVIRSTSLLNELKSLAEECSVCWSECCSYLLAPCCTYCLTYPRWPCWPYLTCPALTGIRKDDMSTKCHYLSSNTCVGTLPDPYLPGWW